MTAKPHAGSGPSDLRVESVTIEGGATPRLLLTGTGALASAALRGGRLTIDSEVGLTDGGWTAIFPLLVARWRGKPLPPPSGSYLLSVTAPDGTSGAAAESAAVEGAAVEGAAVEGAAVEGALPAPVLVDGLFRAEVTRPGDTFVLDVSAPLTDAERGPERQAELEQRYRTTKYAPLDAVFFESFYGQSATCNPLALDREFARVRPDITRYWSVVDASVSVPEGSVALIEGSAEWWRIRGSARLIVANDWLRNRFRRRSFQTVLQTWHGTPLKKIALGRPGVSLRTVLATIRERSRWNIMLSQNAHSTAVFRSAYLFLGPIWQEGYPRDDSLVSGDTTAIRERLGIADDVAVVLYAPTWRDDRPDHVDHLDVAAFTDELGPGYVTLIRGHSRTLRPGRDVLASNVLDVTGYPDVTELFHVADVLITDYSSVMFDYSVTGKPIYFFAPDLDHYREQLRGFYFDLDEAAPGPVVRQAHELVELVLARDTIRATYAEKYAAWQARFNPRDDGHAAERVVARLLKRKAVG